jgi:hypothetical protein
MGGGYSVSIRERGCPRLIARFTVGSQLDLKTFVLSPVAFNFSSDRLLAKSTTADRLTVR